MQDDSPFEPEAHEPQDVRLARHIGSLRAALGDLCTAPPWPARELLIAFRLKAGMADLPKSCPKPACRRARQCRAADIEAGAACGPRWSPTAERDFQNMALGILVAWRVQSVRAGREAALVARWSGADAGRAPLSGARRGAKPRR